MDRVVTQFRGKYKFLSNFFPATIFFRGSIWPSAEHLYQASKPGVWGTEHAEIIRKLPTPAEAKFYVQTLQLPYIDEWLRQNTMLIAVYNKFNQNSNLGDKLCALDGYHLMEGNNWGDTFWGVSLQTGVGSNMLGKILMEVRDNLIRERYKNTTLEAK